MLLRTSLMLIVMCIIGNVIYAQNTFPATGNVGIGTTSPTTPLTIFKSNSSIDPSNSHILLTNSGSGQQNLISSTIGGTIKGKWRNDYFGNIYYVSFGSNHIFMTGGDYGVGIAPMVINSSGIRIKTETLPSGYQLAVGGKIIAEELKLKLQSTGWPDYVFQPSYNLPSLKEIEAFIKKNQHLPDVPSAKTVATEGIELGKNQAILLKKIEELTLYIIEQDKKIEKQNMILEKLVGKEMSTLSKKKTSLFTDRK
ncbi:hypothetical protein U0035_16865 [Niabella yanshanensis]|uniref:SlyX family protein n=1 Tax=Niabella yanshanensis TaxID=577386 RepID=A0ABZ0W2A9_9BACT|nr:hypothetical protein [Niabella yanshanensis]WQD37341.1 hypothetical protein U0035_16865 [Niabella yanshanensis]